MKYTSRHDFQSIIPEGFHEINLGDLITFQRGHDLPNKKRKKGSYPVVASNGIVGFHNEFKVKGPGVIVGRSGNIGEPYYINKNYWPLNTTLYVKEFKSTSPEFVYYFLKSINLGHYNSGSAVPSLNRNYIHPLKIKVPKSITYQNKIASLLSTFDDKIELNCRMNATLEQIAQAIFKQWFIDFEFPDENGQPYKSSGGEMVESEMGEIPRGWEVKPIDEIADFLNGLALKKYPPEGDEYLPVIKIRELKQGITDSTDKASPNIDEKYIIDDGDVLFSWSGSLECCLWSKGKGALNQHLFKVTSEHYPKWFYYFWIMQHLPAYRRIAKDKTTTMGHIKRRHLSESLVLVPPMKTIDRMDVVMKPLFKKTLLNNLNSLLLSLIRDLLLPKLMSGRICLS